MPDDPGLVRLLDFDGLMIEVGGVGQDRRQTSAAG